MIKIKIDKIDLFVEPNTSILEACQHVGAKIPKFCFHENLFIAGNCRMCLVEIANTLKPVASCALSVSDGLKVFTCSPLVKKSRENIMELLLINHPLDCPICDQGGECDLQEQSKQFGADNTRYIFNKRVVEDKNISPIIKTIMTRCIHCTRCVRFSAQVSGSEFLGTLNRGTHTEIGSYSTLSFFKSKISINVIDLCPVGALTSKAYSFKARPWELRTNESIALTDGLSSTVYVSSKESEIVRIFPKVGLDADEFFISDKSRLYFDSNKNNRLLAPSTIPFGKNLMVEREGIMMTRTLILTNNNADMDKLSFVKTLENVSLENKDASIYVKNTNSNTRIKSNFFKNWTNGSLLDNKSYNKVCFLVSCDLNVENSILNTRIRNKTYLSNFIIFGFNKNFDAEFSLKFLNLSLIKFYSFLESKMLGISSFFFKCKNPIFLVSEDLFRRGSNFVFFSSFILNIVSEVKIIKIQNSINQEGSNFLNYSKSNSRFFNFIKILIYLNLEESFNLKKYLIKKTKKIFCFSTHNSEILNTTSNSLVYYLPITTEFEESKAFINLEQKIQKTSECSSPLNKLIFTKEKFLAFFNIKKTFYNSHAEFYVEMLNDTNLFSQLYFSKKFSFSTLNCFNPNSFFYVSPYPTKKLSEDSYLMNKMLKNSVAMISCSRFLRKYSINYHQCK